MISDQIIAPQSNRTTYITQYLLPGMFVRVPVDTEPPSIPGAFRDYCLAQIVEQTTTETIVVEFLTLESRHRLRRTRKEVLAEQLQRCALPDRAIFIHRVTRKRGHVLIPCENGFIEGEYRFYYGQLGDEVQIFSEAEMFVAEHEQSPDPIQQLRSYEFHPNQWKSNRDALLESYSALQTATYGIEDLVGARIMLLAHQAETVARVLGDRTCRYMLADEVGLGKTIEAAVILKGLQRRMPNLRTLIVAPGALIRQWRNELNLKFWLEFTILHDLPSSEVQITVPGVIIAIESIESKKQLWEWVLMQQWGLLIVDEAHNLRKKIDSYNRIHILSKLIERVLILTATPIQRRADEYLLLLKLMHPHHYDTMEPGQFQLMLDNQSIIRGKIAYLARALTPEGFDCREFKEEIAPVLTALQNDEILVQLEHKVTPQNRDGGLQAAIETLQYISHNYRIENRVIRNRRVNLQIKLPTRKMSLEYAYSPTAIEAEVLDVVQTYVQACLTEQSGNQGAVEFCYSLLHASASSPAALLILLQERLNRIQETPLNAKVRKHFPPISQEPMILERAIWQTQPWEEATNAVLTNLPQRTMPDDLPHRLVQVLRAVHQIMRQPTDKVLLFATWDQTLEYLLEKLLKTYGKQAVAQFNNSLSPDDLQIEVDRFQSDDFCRIMLTNESGGEGRNFQIANVIIHVDLPWTPAKIEQRIGRVDRLGRSGEVLSIVPYALGTLEEDLFNLWHQAFHLFEQSMSGMEIVLEDVQDQIATALTQSVRSGLATLLPSLVRSSEQLREAVEEERYYEEVAIDNRLRRDFEEIGASYRDGEILRKSLLSWAEMAGLHYHYNPKSHVAVFNPKDFNEKSIHNAKFVNPPDMTDALRRSGRTHNLVIKGTFDRDLAIQREDFVFFAPGESWTDMILMNALQADRGRCSAVQRDVPELKDDWHGFELFFRISVDPRPLYALGFHPTHLLQAQGYLYSPMHRLFISSSGSVKLSSLVKQALEQPYNKQKDIHLGKRSGPQPPLLTFKELYPMEEWHALIAQTTKVAESVLSKEFDFMHEHAEEAKETFARTAAGQRAAVRWLTGREDTSHSLEIQQYEEISKALIAGIAQPLWRLESACFWILKAGNHA